MSETPIKIGQLWMPVDKRRLARRFEITDYDGTFVTTKTLQSQAKNGRRSRPGRIHEARLRAVYQPVS